MRRPVSGTGCGVRSQVIDEPEAFGVTSFTARVSARTTIARVAVARREGKLILVWQPGGFEKFFDEIGNVPIDKKSPETMRDIINKYGMEMLAPQSSLLRGTATLKLTADSLSLSEEITR
jgi:hypothetical protein